MRFARRRSSEPRGRLRRHARALLVVAAGAAALVAGAGFGTPALRPFGITLVALGLFAIVAVEFAARNVRISRTLDRDRIVAGEPIAVTLRLSGWSPRSGLLRLLDWDAHAAGPPGSAERWQSTRRAQGEIVHRVALAGVARGEHRLGVPWVGIGDPFGLVRVRRAVRSAATVVATARTVPVALPFWEGATRRMGDLAGRVRGRVELGGIRDYEPGDPLSLIHWTQTARRGRLQTKELHGESGRGRRLCVILDARAGDGAGAQEAFEVAVSAAASLVAGCTARGTPVGLVHAGAPPARWPLGSPVSELDRALAVVRPNAVEAIGSVMRAVVSGPDLPDMIAVVTAVDDRGLAAAVGAARAGGVAVAAVLVGDARAGARAIRRAGAITTEAATFDQLRPALDLMAPHG